MKCAALLTVLLLSLGLACDAYGEDAEGGYNWFGDYDNESGSVFDGPGRDDGLEYDSWYVD